MKIYLLDKSREMVSAWKKYFENENVEIVCEDFMLFMDLYDVECVVSPANAYGLMDGGFDLAITNYFGQELQKNVQKIICERYYGEQPVGTSIMVGIPNTNKKLIHTPTMRFPSKILDPKVVYQCMRTTLMVALKNNIKSIVIPAFGGRCGCLEADVVAKMMYMAYKQLQNPPKEISWDYACSQNNI